MKLGYVISVYDRLPDLEQNLILLKAFSIRDVVVVTSADNPVLPDIQGLAAKYDALLVTPQLPTLVQTGSKEKFFESITPRLLISQFSGLLALASKVDIIGHTHADGWVLSCRHLENVKGWFHDPKVNFAFRGTGRGYVNPVGSPLGSVDDHFYYFRSDFVQRSLMINSMGSLVDTKIFNIHGALMLLVNSELGVEGALHYDDGKNWINWDGSSRNHKRGNPLRPYVLNTNEGLLHCNFDDFPGNIGRAAQVTALRRFAPAVTVSNLIVNELAGESIESLLKFSLRRYKWLKLLRWLLWDFTEDYKNLENMKKKIRSEIKRPYLIPKQRLVSLFKFVSFAFGYRIVIESRKND